MIVVVVVIAAGVAVMAAILTEQTAEHSDSFPRILVRRRAHGLGVRRHQGIRPFGPHGGEPGIEAVNRSSTGR